MFETLSGRLQSALDKLKGRGKLTEKDVDAALREVRLALLEADVNFKAVRDLLAKIKERAIGEEVQGSLTPGQQVVKIVFEQLKEMIGGEHVKLDFGSQSPATILMVGLQGSGKTTFSAKLAKRLKSQGRNPLMVAGDVYRPAAIDQLQLLGKEIDVPVFELGTDEKPENIAARAFEEAKRLGYDTLIMDTAGRLHVDDEMMDEIEAIKSAINPAEILFVADAMTGQDAVNVAEAFHQRLQLTGIVLTKLDGDARGGAALSIKAVTGAPVKFIGVGEKLDGLEAFHPERIASRILGMGDVLSLIEKAESTMDLEKSKEMVKKLQQGAQFTLEDFLDQMQQMKQMGPLDQILGMIPGMGKLKNMAGAEVDEKQMDRIEAIIQSMTKAERQNPSVIDGSRRRRIARGSGVKVQDVNKLLKQFEQTRSMMKQFMGAGAKKGRKQLGRLLRG